MLIIKIRSKNIITSLNDQWHVIDIPQRDSVWMSCKMVTYSSNNCIYSISSSRVSSQIDSVWIDVVEDDHVRNQSVIERIWLWIEMSIPRFSDTARIDVDSTSNTVNVVMSHLLPLAVVHVRSVTLSSSVQSNEEWMMWMPYFIVTSPNFMKHSLTSSQRTRSIFNWFEYSHQMYLRDFSMSSLLLRDEGISWGFSCKSGLKDCPPALWLSCSDEYGNIFLYKNRWSDILVGLWWWIRRGNWWVYVC